jgi:drug/metabolite transporter (DMT)-like permease
MNVLLYILLCLLWGSTWLAIKIGLSAAPPFTTAALRFLLAMAVLTLISTARGYRYPTEFKTILRLGYPGVFMYGISYALVYFAEQYINSATTAVLFGAFPFFVAALSWLMYRTEKLSPLGWLGMVIGFAGVVVISYDSLQVSSGLFIGSILAIAAPLAAAYGIVIHKHHFSQLNIVVSVNIQMAFGGLFLILGALLFESWSQFNVSVESIGSIIYLGLFGTVATFLSYYYLIARIPVTTVSLIAFITPLVAILIGVLVANEALTPLIIIGTILILSGVLLVMKKKPDAATPAA